MAKSKKSGTGIVGRILITLLGAVLILWAINDIGLVMWGEKAPVADVNTSRTGGSDSNQPPEKQYRWSVSWTFYVDGKEYTGSATVRGSAIGVKHGRTVYYYPFAPKINSLYAKDGIGLGTVLLVALGLFLIIIVNKKPKENNRFKGKTEKQVESEMKTYDDSVEEFYDKKE